jgi:hypothetical protein
MPSKAEAPFAISNIWPRSEAAWYEGGADDRLSLRTASSGGAIARWFTALTIAAAWAAAWRYPARVEPLVAAGRRWRYALAALAGVFWWIALTPSVLGPAIIVVSVAAFYKDHRGRWELYGEEPRRHNGRDENDLVAGTS